eukprot:TRINITY_DN1582_c0_g2_i6.p1 TRINITY_DN1582_c0_g2~~TRINITY_DN1582_c0_g2_i6.p1  ORF type:complete len:313 (-),score=45.62 TRINITY_DN1582_c0_g2_i6:49-987(-)
MGIGAIIMTIIFLLPFPVMMAYSIPAFNISNVFILPPDLLTRDWALFFSVMIWNVSGFDSLSTVAGELKNPEKMHYALGIAGLMSLATYFFPLLFLVSSAPDYELWVEGYFPVIAENIAGDWLKIFVVLAQGVSSFALLMEYHCTTSFMLAEWCTPEYLDIPFITKKSRFNTPWVALVIVASFSELFALFMTFQMILVIDTWSFAVALIFEFLALIALRYTEPEMKRPFKVPGGKSLAIIMSIIPIILSCVNIILPMISSVVNAIILSSILAISPILYFLNVWYKNRYRQPDEFSLSNIDESQDIIPITTSL